MRREEAMANDLVFCGVGAKWRRDDEGRMITFCVPSTALLTTTMTILSPNILPRVSNTISA